MLEPSQVQEADISSSMRQSSDNAGSQNRNIRLGLGSRRNGVLSSQPSGTPSPQRIDNIRAAREEGSPCLCYLPVLNRM